MQYSFEVLHHFVCDKCKMWWSISALAEIFLNKKAWYCPWCSHEHVPPHDNVTVGHPDTEQLSIDDPSVPDELRERIKKQQDRDQVTKEEFG